MEIMSAIQQSSSAGLQSVPMHFSFKTVLSTDFQSQAPGDCSCKRHVIGRRCDRCKPEYYRLTSDNHLGCIGNQASQFPFLSQLMMTLICSSQINPKKLSNFILISLLLFTRHVYDSLLLFLFITLHSVWPCVFTTLYFAPFPSDPAQCFYQLVDPVMERDFFFRYRVECQCRVLGTVNGSNVCDGVSKPCRYSCAKWCLTIWKYVTWWKGGRQNAKRV